MGDSPIAGAGSYANAKIGGCAATGDGDVMMRFLPCLTATFYLGSNSSLTPDQAAHMALDDIASYYPTFKGALVVLDKNGIYGAANHGLDFYYSVQTPETNGVKVVQVSSL